ncbi:MAG TPA: D-2-hydroxyacid dehydrogenase [Chloroflexota bacterium]|nr:D-2-hydroxyacid dehydrogenase [Chloroflexota bacterium]
MKIVVASRPGDPHLEVFRTTYPEVTFVCVSSPEEARREIVDADAFFGNPSREVFLAAQRLRWIQAPSAGIEFVHGIPELVESDVILTNTRGAHAATIAEHTFAMLLMLTRALRFFDHAKGCHAWLRSEGYRHVNGIAGKTMGIVGLGNIGRAIAQRAHAFEMRVLAVDAQPVPATEHVAAVWGLDRLHDMLRETDVLVISCPITPQTRGMIGETEIRLLRPGAYVLAVSRGGIVQEPALIAALRDGHLAGAGLDVTEVEPLPPDSPLWDVPNLVMTPHISGGSQLTTELMWSIFFENVGHFIRGEPLRNVTDKRLGY